MINELSNNDMVSGAANWLGGLVGSVGGIVDDVDDIYKKIKDMGKDDPEVPAVSKPVAQQPPQEVKITFSDVFKNTNIPLSAVGIGALVLALVLWLRGR